MTSQSPFIKNEHRLASGGPKRRRIVVAQENPLELGRELFEGAKDLWHQGQEVVAPNEQGEPQMDQTDDRLNQRNDQDNDARAMFQSQGASVLPDASGNSDYSRCQQSLYSEGMPESQIPSFLSQLVTLSDSMDMNIMETFPTAVAIYSRNRGNPQRALQILQIVSKYEAQYPGIGAWRIAEDAANGRPFMRDVAALRLSLWGMGDKSGGKDFERALIGTVLPDTPLGQNMDAYNMVRQRRRQEQDNFATALSLAKLTWDKQREQNVREVFEGWRQHLPEWVDSPIGRSMFGFVELVAEWTNIWNGAKYGIGMSGHPQQAGGGASSSQVAYAPTQGGGAPTASPRGAEKTRSKIVRLSQTTSTQPAPSASSEPSQAQNLVQRGGSAYTISQVLSQPNPQRTQIPGGGISWSYSMPNGERWQIVKVSNQPMVVKVIAANGQPLPAPPANAQIDQALQTQLFSARAADPNSFTGPGTGSASMQASPSWAPNQNQTYQNLQQGNRVTQQVQTGKVPAINKEVSTISPEINSQMNDIDKESKAIERDKMTIFDAKYQNLEKLITANPNGSLMGGAPPAAAATPDMIRQQAQELNNELVALDKRAVALIAGVRRMDMIGKGGNVDRDGSELRETLDAAAERVETIQTDLHQKRLSIQEIMKVGPIQQQINELSFQIQQGEEMFQASETGFQGADANSVMRGYTMQPKDPNTGQPMLGADGKPMTIRSPGLVALYKSRMALSAEAIANLRSMAGAAAQTDPALANYAGQRSQYYALLVAQDRTKLYAKISQTMGFKGNPGLFAVSADTRPDVKWLREAAEATAAATRGADHAVEQYWNDLYQGVDHGDHGAGGYGTLIEDAPEHGKDIVEDVKPHHHGKYPYKRKVRKLVSPHHDN